MAHVKKNDQVIVITGKDKGKIGKVLSVLPKKGKVMVEGVALLSHYVRPGRQGERGGIKKKESFIAISNVKVR